MFPCHTSIRNSTGRCQTRHLRDTSLNAGLGWKLSEGKGRERAGRRAPGTVVALQDRLLLPLLGHRCHTVSLAPGAGGLGPDTDTGQRSGSGLAATLLLSHKKYGSCCSCFAPGDVSIFCNRALLFVKKKKKCEFVLLRNISSLSREFSKRLSTQRGQHQMGGTPSAFAVAQTPAVVEGCWSGSSTTKCN